MRRDNHNETGEDPVRANASRPTGKDLGRCECVDPHRRAGTRVVGVLAVKRRTELKPNAR
jgi:hypothetical protein